MVFSDQLNTVSGALKINSPVYRVSGCCGISTHCEIRYMKSVIRRYQARRRDRELVRAARNKAVQVQQRLEYTAVACHDNGIGNSCPDNLIVSLTSYPGRITTLFIVIESLLQQTLRPDHLLLWLSREDFPNERVDLPQSLLNQEARGLEILFVDDNHRSYKKIIPTLDAHSDSIVITVDDDLMYPVDLIDLLYRAHKQHPKDVLCNRARRMIITDTGAPAAYSQWPLLANQAEAGPRVMPTGNHGVLYPPGSLHRDVSNGETYQQLAPFGDDLWLKSMSLINGVSCRVIEDRRHPRMRFLSLPFTFGPGLRDSNRSNNHGNDHQFNALWEHYKLAQYLPPNQ